MEPWVWPIIITIGLALIGAVWALVRRSSERTEQRLDDHIHEDTLAHERLRAVETKVESLEREVKSIRERWHDLRSEITTTLGNWYTQLVNQINKRDR